MSTEAICEITNFTWMFYLLRLRDTSRASTICVSSLLWLIWNLIDNSRSSLGLNHLKSQSNFLFFHRAPKVHFKSGKPAQNLFPLRGRGSHVKPFHSRWSRRYIETVEGRRLRGTLILRFFFSRSHNACTPQNVETLRCLLRRNWTCHLTTLNLLRERIIPEAGLTRREHF